jgi:hypothetical protein
MKNLAKILTVISALVLFLNGCSSKSQNTSQPNSSDQITKGKTLSAKGKVIEIQRGKDGYTAKIETDEKKVYSVTISSVALEKRYREVKVGETIEVEGEDTLGDGSLIRVTAFR